MIGEQQQIRFAVLFKRFSGAVGKRLDVEVVIRIIANKGHSRNAAAGCQNAGKLVPDGGHRRAGVLRIQGQHDNMIHALCQQRVNGAFQRRFTVAHAECDGHIRQTGGQRFFLTTAVHHQRRALFHPDGLIKFGDARRANRQNDATQQRPPQQSRKIHDARVA